MFPKDPLSPLMKASQDVIELRFCENTEPLAVSLPSGFTPHALNSTLATLYDFGPTASFSLSNDGKMAGRLELTQCETFVPNSGGHSFLMSVKQNAPNIDERYDQLKKEGASIKPFLATDGFYLFASGQKTYNSYYFTLFLQRFLVRAIIDIVNNDVTPLSRSLVPYLHPDAPTTIVKKQVITNALIDVLTEFFGDSCMWEVNQQPTLLPVWKNLNGFLAALISKRSISYASIRKAIKPFQPSKLSEYLVIEIIHALRMQMTDSEVFSIISEMFPDKFFQNCFTKKSDIYNTIMSGDFPPIVPFVTISCLVSMALKGKINENAAKEIILQIGHPALFASNRIARAVFNPISEYIYQKILADELPYLEMTKVQLNQIMDTLKKMTVILKATIKNRTIQYELLLRMQKVMEKRGFEPKGLCYVFFSFMYNSEIVHPDVYTLYVQSSNSQIPGRNSVLLEINSFLIEVIPGPFPPINKDAPQYTKKSGLPPH
ncbi:hypothetical protein TRFO_37908 [Tritrichomonas foetus]|uniref:Uncharacterized protein n=1 Tax=Tritrichomonas foetus TaxID=1144522 RepID=A0A1J4JFG2_9EUKA|nr:hypothetical protein TRFO_37908 [Tritrichomonas foetus]|eukprot:OHS95964.1 hypothetical protein TRFO_37908 [Tritrichomonas foetus]